MTVAAVSAELRQRNAAARPWFSLTFERFVGLAAVHVVFAIWLPRASLPATAFALVVVAGSIAAAWIRPSAGPYCALYIAGAELLWRMAAANVFWELGKYGAIAALLLSLRGRFRLTPVTTAATTYFVLLIPATAATVGMLGIAEARSRIAFSLSGPLLLAIGIIAFSVMPLEEVRPQRLLAWLALPIIGVAGRVGWQTVRAEEIIFESEASFATSGGFGPNQVSTILGVGALALFLLAAQSQRRLHQTTFNALGGLLFLEAVLTFSRGGVGSALLGSGALLIHQTASPRRARGYLLGALVLGLTLWFLVLPRVDQWTGGALGERFSSLDSSGRMDIAKSDLDLFLKKPILGVGVGLAPNFRQVKNFGVASHTELTRALSEHGSLGLLSSLCLIGLISVCYWRAPSFGSKAWTAALVAWGLGNMATASLRLAASAAVICLAFIDFRGLKEPGPVDDQ